MQRYIIFLYKKNNYSFLTYRNFIYPQNMFFPPPQKKTTFGQRPKASPIYRQSQSLQVVPHKGNF
jgi:hypothetical protein